jgi:hypothetical protein
VNDKELSENISIEFCIGGGRKILSVSGVLLLVKIGKTSGLGLGLYIVSEKGLVVYSNRD